MTLRTADIEESGLQKCHIKKSRWSTKRVDNNREENKEGGKQRGWTTKRVDNKEDGQQRGRTTKWVVNKE